MKYEVKSIGLWAFVKLAFFLNMAVGFVAGILYAFMVIAMLSFYSNFPLTGFPGMDPAELAPGLLLIILPLVFSFLGGPLLTIIETFVIILYNLFSHFLGGLELTLVVKPQIESNSATASTPAIAPSLRPLPPVLPASPPPPISQSSSIPADSSPSPSPSLNPDKTFNDSGRDDDTTSPTPPPPPQQT